MGSACEQANESINRSSWPRGPEQAPAIGQQVELDLLPTRTIGVRFQLNPPSPPRHRPPASSRLSPLLHVRHGGRMRRGWWLPCSERRSRDPPAEATRRIQKGQIPIQSATAPVGSTQPNGQAGGRGRWVGKATVRPQIATNNWNNWGQIPIKSAVSACATACRRHRGCRRSYMGARRLADTGFVWLPVASGIAAKQLPQPRAPTDRAAAG